MIEVEKALGIRLAALANPLPTAWPNVVLSPPATGYQRVDFLPATPQNPTMGSGFYRELGIFQVTLLFPLGGGSGPVLARAEVIKAGFPRGSTYANGGITTTISGTPAIGPGRVIEDRWVVPVSIAYFANVSS
jgi:Bacteriophage related domain of unknown function